MFDQIIQWVENLSLLIPLPLFVIIGSFLEEIIPPIPSPLIMTSAGSIIEARELGFLYILMIASAGALTKTIASLILYYFSDKVEDILSKKFNKTLSISGYSLENIGKYFNNTRRDDVVLFFLRSIPIFPNGPVSILCGAIKLNLKTFISMTFIGTVTKNLLYIYMGVLGIEYLDSISQNYNLIENMGYLALCTAGLFFMYHVYRKKKNQYQKKKTDL